MTDRNEEIINMTLRHIQYGHHFADNIFKCMFSNENCLLIKISLRCLPKSIKNKFNDAICITVTSKWVWWHLKSSESRLFTQPFIQAQIKENIKALRHWPLCGIHRSPVNSPHKWPVRRKIFPFDDVIMASQSFTEIYTFLRAAKKGPVQLSSIWTNNHKKDR